jgi:hypothetical protein
LIVEREISVMASRKNILKSDSESLSDSRFKEELLIYVVVFIHAAFINLPLAIFIGAAFLAHVISDAGSKLRWISNFFGSCALLFYLFYYLIPMLFK